MVSKIVNGRLLAFSGLAVASFTAGCNEVQDKPNVIFICVDDMNGYGITDIYAPIKTPSLDRLRDKSVYYTASFCPSPVRVTSRSAFFSRLYPHNKGANINEGDPLRKSAALREAETNPVRRELAGWGKILCHKSMTSGTVYPDGGEEPNDLQADRCEHNNMIGSPLCEEIISCLSGFIPTVWVESTGGRYEVPSHQINSDISKPIN